MDSINLNKYLIPTTKDYIFNETPLFINYDKWIKGINNVLYVTGLSGTGKGYYAKQIAKNKKNCIIIELDKFENYIWYINKPENNPSIKAGDEIIYNYLKSNYDLSYDIFQNNITNYNQILTEFYDYLLWYTSEHSQTSFIIEGIQIFSDKAFNKISNNDSIVILRSSTVKSMQKVLDREHNTIRNRMHTYTDAKKMLKEFELRFSSGISMSSKQELIE